MLQYPTPNKIAFLTALIQTIFIGAVSGLAIYYQKLNLNVLLLIGLLVVFLAISYYVFNSLINSFIYKRIKVIYKNINNSKHKDNSMEEAAYQQVGALDNAEKDVAKWVDDQNNEIRNLKSLETYRREFLGNISHELKTPIFNIQGYIHTLLDGGIFDENINIDYLKKAANNTERLQVIIEDLDAISKLETGELVLEKQRFDIKKLVLEVYEELSLMAKKNNMNLAFRPGASNSHMVVADKKGIRQVLNNLITNAIKYSKEEGEVLTSFYDMDENLLVEVADNGIGIPSGHLKHLFDRFYRVDKHRSRTVGGSGLGLSIVKHIMEAHNQKIHVRSTENIGSTFSFTLDKD